MRPRTVSIYTLVMLLARAPLARLLVGLAVASITGTGCANDGGEERRVHQDVRGLCTQPVFASGSQLLLDVAAFTNACPGLARCEVDVVDADGRKTIHLTIVTDHSSENPKTFECYHGGQVEVVTCDIPALPPAEHELTAGGMTQPLQVSDESGSVTVCTLPASE